MKTHFWSLFASCAFAVSFAVAQTPNVPNDSETPDTPKKKEKVTKMDGTSFFGIVTLTDDYTLKISNDTGIMKVPLALLGVKDFDKYTSGKDRSKDGKLWSERKEALEDQKEENSKEESKDGSKKKSSGDDNSAIEIQLGEIAVFQPVISVYESTLKDKMPGSNSSDSKKEGEGDDKQASKEDSSPVRLFSGPGAGGMRL